MRRILALGLMAVCLGAGAAPAGELPPVREVVSFGDSLSDCGAFGFKPTTAPSPTWNQLVARHYGYDLGPNWIGRQPGVAGGIPCPEKAVMVRRIFFHSNFVIMTWSRW